MELFIPIAIVVVALFIALAVLAQRAAEARRAALAKLAQQWGVEFSPHRIQDPERRFPGIAWFAQGDDRWLSNTLAGSIELGERQVALRAGDFTYETSTTDSKGHRTTSTYHLSYLVVDLGLATPDLAVRPEGFGDKFKALFGFSDIEFESAEFNRRFHVRSSDKKFAYDLFHARAQEWLMASSRWRAFELASGKLLIPGDKQWQPSTFAAAREFAGEILAQWPEFVWRDLADRGSRPD